jgi:transposase
MVRPYSMDLRERVLLAVERDGMSARSAAAHFGVSHSSAIKVDYRSVWAFAHDEGLSFKKSALPARMPKPPQKLRLCVNVNASDSGCSLTPT